MVYRWRLIALSRGIRLEEIAQRIGKSLPYVSRISRGVGTLPSNEVKAAIAESLEVPVEKAWRRVNG